ncbi:unnamed protein product, partial [Strongylus vulgaris]
LSIPKATFVVLRQGHPLSDPNRANVDSPYRLGISVLNGISGVWMPVIVVPETYDGPEMHLNARCGDEVADSVLVEEFKIKSDRRRLMPMSLRDVEELAAFGRYGGYMTSRTLQDWVVSRQRSWGTPIPMILSADGKTAVPIADNKLPLLQGEMAGKKVDYCRKVKDSLKLTLWTPSLILLGWYYLRFLDPHNENALISQEAAARMPVDIYVGGIEHAAVHMFFARFISYFLTDIGVTVVGFCSFVNEEAEPFRNLIPQGIVRGRTFTDSNGKYVPNAEVIMQDKKYLAKDGTELTMDYEKMSKSKGNGLSDARMAS